MIGHLQEENGVLVTETYFAPHAHNLYLQQAFDFGIVIGILFIVYLLLHLIRLWRNAYCTKVSCNMGVLLFLLNGCVFGLTEMMWANGYMAFTLLFLTTSISIGCVELPVCNKT
jgi:O-antigen ligase